MKSIIDCVLEAGYTPKRKASCHGGEYCSPCPFCREGEDRFIIQPQRCNEDGSYKGGRFACRVCGRSGDMITFLRDFHNYNYFEACAQLQIVPFKEKHSRLYRQAPRINAVIEPSDVWKKKAQSFAEWAYKELLNHNEGLKQFKERGLNRESIDRFTLGFNSRTFFCERQDWGLTPEVKEDGKMRKIWLPSGLVIPTFLEGQLIKLKIRRSGWQLGDKFPKYVEVSGSRQTFSIYGNTSLDCAIVLESELDAMLIQQEAGDLVYCVALGGSTKPLDVQTSQLLKKTPLILFLPDFDLAGKIAWEKWKKLFPHIQRILTPCEKSAGDYFQKGGNLRKWLQGIVKAKEKTI